MPKLTVKAIKKAIAEYEADVVSHTSKRDKLRAKVDETLKALKKAERGLENIRHTIVCLEELVILTTGLPPDIAKLRHDYAASKARAQSDEVSVRQAREAHEKSTQLRKQLEESCPHTLLVYSQAFEGSSCMDYDDGYPECRRCLICGGTESGPKFEKMVPGPGKILRYQYHMKDNLKPPYLHREFFEDDEMKLFSHFENRTLVTLREHLTSEK